MEAVTEPWVQLIQNCVVLVVPVGLVLFVRAARPGLRQGYLRRARGPLCALPPLVSVALVRVNLVVDLVSGKYGDAGPGRRLPALGRPAHRHLPRPVGAAPPARPPRADPAAGDRPLNPGHAAARPRDGGGPGRAYPPGQTGRSQTVASGGRVSRRAAGRPWVPGSSGLRGSGLPMPPPPYRSSSVLRTSRHTVWASGTPRA